MKRVCVVVFALLLILSIGAVAADKDGWFFVQIADTQMGFSNGNRDSTVEIENFQKAVRYINKVKPALVVISGDMVNIAHNPKQIREFWRVAHEIRPDVPLYLVAGNHDIGTVSEANIRSYTKLFGADHYSFSHQGTWFIVLNSNLINGSAAAPDLYEEQRKWFENELETISGKNPAHIFVLTHHPWFINDVDEKESYQNIASAKRPEYLSLMKQHGVDFALAGHLHREAISQYGPISMITTAPLSKSHGKEAVGFRVFHVRPDRVEHTYYTLDQMNEGKVLGLKD